MRSFAWVACGLLFIACSDETSTLDTGVDDSKQVKDLSADDVQRICDAVVDTTRDFLDNNRDNLCSFSAAFAGAFAQGLGQNGEQVCQEALDNCEQVQAPETECDLQTSPECEVTVGEMEACFNDALGAIDDYFEQFEGKACSELISVQAGELPVDPQSCRDLEAKCPTLAFGFDDDD